MAKVVYLMKKSSDKLEALIEGFKKHLLETDRSGSLKPYLGDVERFSAWFAPDGDFAPNAVSPLDLVQYRQRLQEQGKAPSTVNRALTSLKVFFGWLVRQGGIRDNPAQDVKPVSEAAARLAPKWLSRPQQAALMRAVGEGDNARDEAIVGLMLHAGLIVSEGLRPSAGGRAHTLRHTFCKNAIDLGVPIDQVAVMAGHSSLDVTRRYTAPGMVDLQNAVERVAWE